MRICMLAAEIAPYAVVGELAEVVRGLSLSLADLEVEVRVFCPLYPSVRKQAGVGKILDLDPVKIGSTTYPVELFADTAESPVKKYFIACERLFDRKGIYQDPVSGQDHPDNFERYDLFCIASLDALKRLEWQPDVVHCHDSHTALVPAYLKLLHMGDPFYSRISTVLTVYDLSYHGQFPGDRFELTQLPQELFYPMGPFEYFGKLSTLKGGICYADMLNTISHQYAREILTKDYGCGLEEVLRRRRENLIGILNGIDMEQWDPATDPLLPSNFSKEDPSAKKENKKQLQKAFGLPENDSVPVIGLISRLPHQDGLDLFLAGREELMQLDCQWIVVGDKLRGRCEELNELVSQHPEKVSFQKNIGEPRTHLFHAGCDMLLMVPNTQPCGLNQLYSMRYGAIPVVSHAGGLVETVQQFEPETGKGCGFKFFGNDPGDLAKVVRSAIRLWKDSPEDWKILVANAMSQDFSWQKSAREYHQLYRRAMAHG